MTLTLAEERVACAQARHWLDATGQPGISRFSGDIGPHYNLRVSGHPAANSWVVPEVFQPSFEVLRRMSRGRIGVTGSWGESAHPAREGFAALADGRTDLAPCYTSWEPEVFPLSQLLALPNLFPSSAVATEVSEQLYPTYLQAEFERPGVIMGRLKATGAYHLFARRPLRRLSDLRGLRIATNAGIDSRIAQALGAEAVPLSSVELLPAYLADRVDAVSLADGSAQVFGVGRVSRTRVEIGAAMMNLEFGLSRRFHDDLPPDLQQVLNDWLRAQAQAETQYFYGVGGALAREGFLAAGCEFVTLPPEDLEELNQRLDQLRDGIAADMDAHGLPGTAFVRSAQAAVQALAGADGNTLMQHALATPRWLLPGTRPE